MDIPVELFGQVVEDGEIYWFNKGCPVGVLGHRHVCVRHKGKVLVFGTCSSKIQTAIRYAQYKHESMDLYPMFSPSATNALTEITYVDCNKVFTVTEEEFGEWQAKSYIKKDKGTLGEFEMQLLVKGVLLSTQVAEETKDLFRE